MSWDEQVKPSAQGGGTGAVERGDGRPAGTVALGSGPGAGGGAGTARAGGEMTQSMSPATTPVHREVPHGGLAPGVVFAEKYEIVRVLGVGGMGQVYQARHRELDTLVALKIMVGHLAHQPEAVERFKREARAMARVSHPHAVRVLDAGMAGERLYLVMEFLEGQTLRAWHERWRTAGQSPPLEAVVRYALEVLDVLEFMHRRQITHRDLKPDNIFLAQGVDGVETVKVLDFGIAKIQTATAVGLTNEGLIMGTPHYMSPEQCQGLPVDGRTDLYALGGILYELLSGEVPFTGDHPVSVALRHVHEPPPALRERCPAVPEELAAVIHQAMEKAPGRRFRSADDFARALRLAAGKHGLSFREGRGADGPGMEKPGAEKVPSMTAAGQVREGTTWPFPVVETGGGRWWNVALGVLGVLAGLGGLLWWALNGGWSGIRVPAPVATRVPGVPERETVPPELDGFVFVPGGEMAMGRPAGTEGLVELEKLVGSAPEDEVPAHPVHVDGFYLSRYETTNADYHRFVAATGHPAPAGWKDGKIPPGQADFPVTGISWHDAQAYCAWLTQRGTGGVVFRLPTEAEWEYAARGQDGRLFPWGNFWRDGLANTGQALGSGQTLLLPVNVEPNNTRDRSALGICGMGGNVCEWTASDFEVYPGSSYRPTEADRACKVYRGGHFASPLRDALATSRKWTRPEKTSPFVGFRVAADRLRGEPGR